MVMQIKTTSYHYTPIRIAKKTVATSTGENTEKRNYLYIAAGNVK